MTAWNEIKARFEKGESIRAIARDMTERGEKITHQAISKRKRKERWGQPGNPDKWQPQAEQTDTSQALEDPQTHKDKLLASLGKRSPETAAVILASLEKGQTYTTAAGEAGISSETLRKWHQDDEAFDKLCLKARMGSLGLSEQRIAKAGERGDWKADQARLRGAKEMQDEWSADGTGGGVSFNITLNIPRGNPDEPIIIEGGKSDD